jgi:hypothetical protein
MLFQLYGKMARLYTKLMDDSTKQPKANPPQMYGQFRWEDAEDAKNFLKQYVAKSGPLTLKALVKVGAPGIFDKNEEAMKALVGPTLKVIAGDSRKNFDATIKALLEEEDKACQKWKVDHPKKGRPGAA